MTNRSCVVFDCCVISGHRPGSLRQHFLIFSPFVDQMFRHTLTGFSSQHLTSCQWRQSLRGLSFLKCLSPERAHLPRIDPQRIISLSESPLLRDHNYTCKSCLQQQLYCVWVTVRKYMYTIGPLEFCLPQTPKCVMAQAEQERIILHTTFSGVRLITHFQSQ